MNGILPFLLFRTRQLDVGAGFSPLRDGPKPVLTLILATLATLATISPAHAQTEIPVIMDPGLARTAARIAIPYPTLKPPVAAEVIHEPFFAPLQNDLAASGVFEIAALPPSLPPTIETAKKSAAHYLLGLTMSQGGEEYVIEARLLDMTGTLQHGRRYRGPLTALPRIAHTLANDLVRSVSGRPGIFLTQIAFASNRDGAWEIYLMDWDGSNQRRITRHNGLSILPSWSPDNERMVYTSFAAGTSDMYIINRRGGGRVRVPTKLNLNTSATFSSVGNDIAFVGSIAGNPDIYLIRDDGANLRRLTSANSIESTPEWSPNGRQISFTSGRSGTPQIYVMDAEGTNVERISFNGEWNDDAAWSPDGGNLAYTSQVNRRFQIRIANLVSRESRIVAGEGSNEQPAWSPDGQWIAFQSNRSGKWQVYRMRVDGTDLRQLTFTGENKEPDWSKKSE